MLNLFRFTCILLLVLPAMDGLAQNAKKVLDHDVYDFWNRFTQRAISSDGAWVLYGYGPDQKDATLRVHGVASGATYTFARGEDARFTRDAAHVLFMIRPAEDSLKAARKAKKEEDEMPKDTLAVLNLATGDVLRIPRVQSYSAPEEAGGVIAYHLEPEPADTTAEEGNGTTEGTVVLHNLEDGAEIMLPHAKSYAFSEQGRFLAVTTATPDSVNSGVLLVDTDRRSIDTLLTGKGDYSQLAFDEAETQLAFLSNRDDHEADNPAVKVYHWKDGVLDTLVTADSPGVEDGWWIGPRTDLQFSKSGARLFFGTQPRPEPEPEDDEDDDEKVVLDIWNWKDMLLQPMQLVQLQSQRNRTYDAVVHLDERRVVQLGREDMPFVDVGREGDAAIGLANTNMPYQREISWESPRYNDVYSVRIDDGSRALLLSRIQGTAYLSPEAQYVSWWDRDIRAWMAMSSDGGAAVNVSAALPYRVDNEMHDWPYKPSSYGRVGWTEGDEAFLVYDRYDIWALDPEGKSEPRAVTDGFGRHSKLRLRNLQLDDDEVAISGALLLSAQHDETKEGGFYADDLDGDDVPEELIMMARSFGYPQKAADAEALLYTRESFEEFENLWVSQDGTFADMQRVSDLNPQQADYRWGTAELVSWTSLDGIPLKGMLFKPEDFDPAEKYPMMVYFYEKMSNGLYQHRPPGAGGSSINFSFYVSRGYLVFVPDIPYKVGYPGESALNAVVPGVTMLINQGFVQEDNIGVQGHSWGGYQIAYMVTETNLFKAAEAGAPVSNMTSAYGGIRWGSGMSRMFQYEQTQSRIGGSLWEYPLRYIDNSPLFQADKIETPVLMMHNDDDGAVPWYQGIEFFVALRRLGKPVWMLNYNGAGHGLRTFANRKDWTIRMQQFFDHYLKDAPPPVWMERGVPATQKGKTLGLELVDSR